MTKTLAVAVLVFCQAGLAPVADAEPGEGPGALAPGSGRARLSATRSALLKNVAEQVTKVFAANNETEIFESGRMCRKAVAEALSAGVPKNTLVQIKDGRQSCAYEDERNIMCQNITREINQAWTSPDQSQSDDDWMSLENINNKICLNFTLIMGWEKSFVRYLFSVMNMIKRLEGKYYTCFGPRAGASSKYDIREFIEVELSYCSEIYRTALRELPGATKIHIDFSIFADENIPATLTTIDDINDKICSYARRLATKKLNELKCSAVAAAPSNPAPSLDEEDNPEATNYLRFAKVLTGDKRSVFQNEKLLSLLPLRGRGGRKLSTPQDLAESDGWYTCTVSRAKLVPTWSVGGWRFKGDHLDTPYRDTGVGADDCPSHAFP